MIEIFSQNNSAALSKCVQSMNDRIEGGCRFVEKDDLRRPEERECDCELADVATTDLAYRFIAQHLKFEDVLIAELEEQ
jgi:hypothetical protein